MKLILAIVSNDDASAVSAALTKNNFYMTRLATTGGFLRAGNTTIIVGTEDELIDLIKEEKGLSNPTVIELRADKTAESLISRFVKATTKSFISELNSDVNSNKVERSYLG